jgi:hypothetical protein
LLIHEVSVASFDLSKGAIILPKSAPYFLAKHRRSSSSSRVCCKPGIASRVDAQNTYIVQECSEGRRYPFEIMSYPPKYRTPNSRARIATQLMSSSPSLPADRDILEGLLPLHVSIVAKPSASANADEKKIKVQDLKYIGSYNWVESQKPTIIVPGKIARDSPMVLPSHLPRQDHLQNGVTRQLHIKLTLILAWYSLIRMAFGHPMPFFYLSSEQLT